MANYNFTLDKIESDKTEHEIGSMLESYGFDVLDFGCDKRYDLFTRYGYTFYLFEIKEDFTCAHSGNIGLEFSCRGKISGINTSKADFYIYKVHNPTGGIDYLLIKKSTLQKMINEHVYSRVIVSGDKDSNSKNYLFKYDDFKKYSMPLNRINEIIKS